MPKPHDQLRSDKGITFVRLLPAERAALEGLHRRTGFTRSFILREAFSAALAGREATWREQMP